MRNGLLVVLLWASGAAAAPRVAVLPFTGGEGAFVREQVLAAICEQLTCVPPSQVLGRHGAEWSKVRAAGLDGVVEGTLTKAHGAPALSLELFDKPKHSSWQMTVKLDRRGHLAAHQDRKVMAELGRRLHVAAPPKAVASAEAPAAPVPAPAGVPEPAPEASPAPQPTAKTSASAPAPAGPAARPTPTPAETATASAREPKAGPPRRYKPLPPELLDFKPRI